MKLASKRPWTLSHGSQWLKPQRNKSNSNDRETWMGIYQLDKTKLEDDRVPERGTIRNESNWNWNWFTWRSILDYMSLMGSKFSVIVVRKAHSIALFMLGDVRAELWQFSDEFVFSTSSVIWLYTCHSIRRCFFRSRATKWFLWITHELTITGLHAPTQLQMPNRSDLNWRCGYLCSGNSKHATPHCYFERLHLIWPATSSIDFARFDLHFFSKRNDVVHITTFVTCIYFCSPFE